MIDPDNGPLDPKAAAALVLRLVDDIDESSESDRDALLSALLSAAWGGAAAMSQ